MADDSGEFDKTLEKARRTFGGYADTIAGSPRSTIEPKLAVPSERKSQPGQSLFSRVGMKTDGNLDGRLNFEEKLGEGGMGVVRLATQLSLNRKVAVKTLKGEKQDDQSALRLLREGWVTGSLEHPNVVPVHDIGHDKSSPMIVFKRIEGIEWAELIADREAVKRRFGADDLLEWNLRILIQICNAVAFAHSRQVVHRDLKPENVMIGEFGEVYVVDWGIAINLDKEAEAPFFISSGDEIAGTPCYMAPEMLGLEGTSIDERTDVYLLGGMLYEALVEQPPHVATDTSAIIASVVASNPRFFPDTPAELASICRQAMAAEPKDRYQSAKAFRQAIEAFLRHRDSARLAKEAEQRLALLQQALDGSERDDAVDDRPRIYGLFSECRFGFQHALVAWAENRPAAQGIERAVELMATYELESGDARAAARLLAELSDVPADLAKRVEVAQKAQQEKQQEIEEFARIGAQMDPEVGRRTRTILTLGIGSIWVMVPLFTEWFVRDTRLESNLNFALATALVFPLVGAMVFWARETLMKTAVNRRITLSVALVAVTDLALSLLAHRLEISPGSSMTLAIFSWAVITGMMTISIDWRIMPTALGYVLATAVVAHAPEARYYAIAVCNAVLTANLAIIWWPKEQAPNSKSSIPSR